MCRARQHLVATIFDKRGRVLSKGTNSYLKSHPLQKQFASLVDREDAIFLHAEIAAIAKLKDWSKAHKIKVERFTKDGQPALAKPCEICEGAIKSVGIKIVEHT